MSQKLKIRIINLGTPSAADDIAALRQRLSPKGDVVSPAARARTIEVFGEPLSPAEVVKRICTDVRNQGLAAILRYSHLLDRVEMSADQVRVPQSEIDAAHRQADPAFLNTVRRIRANILEFQQSCLHRNVTVKRPDGTVLQNRYVPLARVGICVPGGAAAYPSTLLMTAVPAMVAGVGEIAISAPPTPFGANNPDLLAVCKELQISEVYRLGGAHGVAALAYGVEGIPRVDKIVGPGNLFVALAKKHVFGDVAIDSIAGPSEIVIVADQSASAEFAAADMIAQAEHSPGASILITWHEPFVDHVIQELESQLTQAPRGDLAKKSLEDFGAVILTRDKQSALDLANQLAPEHLHLATESAEHDLAEIRSAGAVFVGRYSAVALGDYVAGPSHVLPTAGTARFASGLTVNDFQRHYSVIQFSRQGVQNVANDIELMTEKEGLPAHKASVLRRLK